MKIIEKIRATDDLSSFGTLLKFAALVYENEEEGEANSPFQPRNIDGDVVFTNDRESADAAFEAWVKCLKDAEEQFLEEGDEEGFVALFETPKGLMILAGSNIMGYDGPDLDVLLPGAQQYIGMPHVEWSRILRDVFGDQDQWKWWAGSDDEEYRLAGPCNTKEQAINEAYGRTDPGDKIYLVEAVIGELDEYTDLYEFVSTRNQEMIIRTED